MNEYKVQTIDRVTGAEDFVTVTAASERAAFDSVAEDGFIVGKIKYRGPHFAPKPVPPPKPSEPFDAMNMLSIPMAFFILVGIVWTIAAWQMPTTRGDTYNIGMIADREAAMGVGRTILTCGVIGLMGVEIIRSIRSK